VAAGSAAVDVRQHGRGTCASTSSSHLQLLPLSGIDMEHWLEPLRNQSSTFPASGDNLVLRSHG
jgi:hypothetical protein